MKALYNIERCQRKLPSILQMSIWDETFDENRHRLQKDLNDFCGVLKGEVTFNHWWSLRESKLEAQRRREHQDGSN
jgi:hypothetical protein